MHTWKDGSALGYVCSQGCVKESTAVLCCAQAGVAAVPEHTRAQQRCCARTRRHSDVE